MEIMSMITGRIRHLPWLGAESTAVAGFDGSVGPNFDGENEISGCECVCEVAFAYDELLKLADQHFGDLDSGIAFGGVDNGEAVLVAPSRDDTFADRVLEDREGRTSSFVRGIHDLNFSVRI